MIYSIDLAHALLCTGLVLLVAHLFALAQGKRTQAWLRAFPRSKTAGFILLVGAAVWSWLLIKNIDLGEFTNWRQRILILIPIAALLALFYVDEFLSVRALGMLALLVAEPLLESAWLRPEACRLFLVTLTYVWIVLGLFWIGMPYTLRDQIAWVSKTDGRWKLAACGGVTYGIVLLICGWMVRG